MTKPVFSTLALAALLAMAGCVSLEPTLPSAAPAIPEQWPAAPVTGVAPAAAAAANAATAPDGIAAADTGWRDFFADPKLAELIARALTNNRDLRVAVANVERARAQYRIVRADRLPAVGASATMTRGGDGPQLSPQYSVGLGITAFELDLFGRVRNLSDAALQQYFAQEEARRAAQLALVAEIANAYLTLGADRELQQLARDTLANRRKALELAERQHELGAVSALDLSQAQTAAESARTDVARYAGQVARDINALNLLVGAPVEEALLPARFGPDTSDLALLPAGLPAEVLLRRPDVQQAEHLLRAANADIGAARAAFFPSISLTASIGSASNELSDLFSSGTRVWSFVPQINLPIFQGGRLRAALGMSQAERDAALAQYEKSIQNGFREVADALALGSTLAEQKEAQQALVTAATRADQLSRARYEAGRDSYLVLLDSQRTLYQAQQSLVTTRLAEQSNRVTLYQVLGGGWHEHSQNAQ